MAQTQVQTAKQTKSSSPHFRPLGNRVLVRRLEAEEKLKGGILLPDSAKKKQEQAEVIALGAGKLDKTGKEIPIPLQVGHIILMEKYSGQEITLDDQEYVIVNADEIIAIVEK